MKLEENSQPVVETKQPDTNCEITPHYDEVMGYVEMPISKGYLDKCIPLVNFIETYQGEGPNCGKKMVLTRFKYCNLACPFCDTQKYTKELVPTLYSLKDVDVLLKTSPNLMITGGEPTLNNKVASDNELSQLESTIHMVRNLNYEFLDIETNGFNMPVLLNECDITAVERGKNINISWSPKFITEADREKNYTTLKYLISHSGYTVKPVIKIVIGDDMKEYEEFIYRAVTHYNFNSNRVYLMPKGTTYEEINHSMKRVLNVAHDLSCNVSSRLHILHSFA